MKNVYIIITVILTLFGCSEMEIKWVKKVDPLGPGPGNYRINDISTLKKYGTYVTGSYWTEDKRPCCLIVKYNVNGELKWYSIYEQENIESTEGKSISVMRTQDNLSESCWGIYVHIQATDRASNKNSTLAKYDSLGNLEWERILDKSSGESEAESVMLTDYSNNIYIAGLRTNSKDSLNIFIAKYNKIGKKIWSTRYYNPALCVHHIKFDIKNPDQLIIGGVSKSTNDFFFIKCDSTGEFTNLTKHLTNEQEDTMADIKIAPDGNVYITGTSIGNETDDDYLTVVYDKNDNLLWTKRFDGPAHKGDNPKRIAFDFFGDSYNTYVFGSSMNKRGIFDIVVIKYDKEGNEKDTIIFKGRKNEFAGMYMLQLGFMHYKKKSYVHYIRDFYVASCIGNDAVLLKYNTKGVLSWSVKYKGKGAVNKPTAFSGNCIAVESKSEKYSDAILIKYGRTEQLGIARWD